MMARYSKALKRSRQWDRDVNVFKLHAKSMSSSPPLRANVEDPDAHNREIQRRREQHYKDFEEFKAAVDKAIEKDPFGTLFGRRWQSPPTSNNSAWTAWSWFSDPNRIKEEMTQKPQEQRIQKEPMEAPHKPTSSSPTTKTTPAHDTAPSRAQTSTTTASSYLSSRAFQSKIEYVYDPVSGRKVLKNPPKSAPTILEKQRAAEAAAEAAKRNPPPPPPRTKSLLERLFLEPPDSTVPVKPYIPKVYGYNPAPRNGDSKAKATIDFENDKKAKIKEKMRNTLGNSIDTAMEFGGKFYIPPEDGNIPDPRMSEERGPRERKFAPEPEDTPLFTNTTYAGKNVEQKSKSDFLEKEGFRAKQGMTLPGLSKTSPPLTRRPITQIQSVIERNAAIKIPVKKFAVKLEPALDRANTKAPLRPAVDRVMGKSSSEVPVKIFSRTAEPMSKLFAEPIDKLEDLDLLRASDVRAQTKTSRVTKLEAEQKKQQERTELEKDFEARQQQEQDVVGVGARSAPRSVADASSNLDNVWKHVKDYPQGVVARTMARMGFSAGTGSAQTTPKFSEPTVRADVARSPAMEKHTQEFEPKLASIVDQAKAIKRELHNVSLTIGDVANQKAITAVAARHMMQTKPSSTAVIDIKVIEQAAKPAVTETTRNEPQSPPPSGATSSAISSTFQSPYVMLTYNTSLDDVELTPLTNLMGTTSMPQSKLNAMAAIGSLRNPNAFIKYFVELDKSGYQLLSGGSDMLIFAKQSESESETTIGESEAASASPSTSSESLRSAIAAAEMAAQPLATIAPVKTATVLDNIPTSIPTPAPSAPVEPRPVSTTSETSSPAQKPTTVIPIAGITPSISFNTTNPANTSTATSSSRVRRQEEVFSGQKKAPIVHPDSPEALWSIMPEPVASPGTTAMPMAGTATDAQTAEIKSDRRARKARVEKQYHHRETFSRRRRSGFFARARKTIKRTVLTITVLGSGAYGLGVLAERSQAAQAGSTSGSASGTTSTGGMGVGMKKMVMNER